MFSLRHVSLQAGVFVAVVAIISLLVLYPVGMMVVGTVKSSGSQLTLEHWREVLNLPILGEIIFNTVVVSVAATILAVVLGLSFALLVSRTDLPMRSAFENISIVPFLTPPIIAGLAWQQLAERQSGILNIFLEYMGIPWRLDVMSLGGLIFVSALYLVPFVFLITVNAIRSINPELEEASVISGADRRKTLTKITLPLLMPSISSGALLAFMYSNVLFGIHATLGMPVNIWFLTTAVYQAVSVVPAQFPRAAVFSCLLMALAMTATYLQLRVLGQRGGYQTLAGKGMRSKVISLGYWRWPAWLICAGYIFVVAVLPYAVLFLRSLKPYMFQSGMSWIDVFSGWDFARYLSILYSEDTTLTRSLWNSLILALGGAAAGTALTAFAAYFVTRTNLPGRKILNVLCMIPMALPGVVLGIAVLWAYSQPYVMLYGTLWILLIAYTTKDMPIGFRSAHSSFTQIHSELEEASRVCGAGWVRQLATITVPLAKPGLVIAFVLIFASILREVGASIILYTQGTEVVAYVIFNLWENGELQALSAFIMVTTALTLVVVVVLLRFSRLRFTDLTGSEVRQS